jgi:hypothetical protein
MRSLTALNARNGLTVRRAVLTVATTLLLAGCTGTAAAPATSARPAANSSAPAQPAAANPVIAGNPAVAAQPAANPAVAAASAKPAAPSAPAQPAAATTSGSGACPALTVADIKAVTGQDVQGAAPREYANVTACGTFATASGRPFLSINAIPTSTEYAHQVQAARREAGQDGKTLADQPLAGLGDEAVFLKGASGNAEMRFLLARKGEHGVELMPSVGARDVTDDMLKQLLATALAHA